MKNRIIPLIKKIVENSYIKNSQEEAIELSSILKEYIGNAPHFNDSNWNLEDRLEGGVALSSHHASTCIFDHKRTSAFLKGAYSAIQELLKRFPGEKITILYAGCGPLGPILLPLLPLFSAQRVEVILLDIHQSSIDSVRHLVSTLGLGDYILSYEVGNAITYQKPIGTKLHMVLTETMQAALVAEPQVAISLNLIPQLEPEGIIVPEKINIELACADYSKLPYLRQRDNHCVLINSDQALEVPPIILGTALLVDKALGHQNIGQKPSSFKTSWELPELDTKTHPDLCLFTSLSIFGNTIEMADTMITNPYCLTNLWRENTVTNFQLSYDFKNTPSWSINTLDKNKKRA